MKTRSQIKTCESSEHFIDTVIVNFNSTHHLIGCLRSMEGKQNGYRPSIFIQDNASNDGVEQVSILYPTAALTQNSHNLGFAKAVNRAIQQGNSKYVILLNPDTFITSDFFHACLSFLEKNPTVGILGPKILDPDGRLQNSARAFPTPLTALFGRSSALSKWFPRNSMTVRNLPSSQSDGRSPISVDWVSGACMVVRRKAIEEVGLLDERFFMYWEDADWCRRMREKGWEVVYYPGASVVHHIGGSSTSQPIRSRFEFHKSVYRLFDKYHRGLMTVAGPLALCILALRFFMLASPHLIRNMAGGGTRIKKREQKSFRRSDIIPKRKPPDLPGTTHRSGRSMVGQFGAV